MAWVTVRAGAELTVDDVARVLPGPHRPLQDPALRADHRRVPDDRHRQDPEVQVARAGGRPARPPGRGGHPHGMRTWTIRELADEFGVSLRTIRFYEEHGIVEPTRHGQRRVFHERDRTRLALALRGRRIGLSVAESKAIIELYDIADHTTQLQSLLPGRAPPACRRRSAQGRPRTSPRRPARGRGAVRRRTRERARMSEHHEAAVKRLRDAMVRAPKGNLATGADKLAAQHKLFVRDRIALLVDDGTFVEDGLLANATAPGDDLPADGVVTGTGPGRRAPGVHHGQRPDGEGRIVGGANGREDHPPHRDRAARRVTRGVAGRLGRRPHHRSGADVPGPPRRRTHLLQPGPAVGPGPAGVLPVRAVGGRGRVHPGVLRRRVHGRRQRLDVPRLATHGRGGDRREGHARGDGRRSHAHVGLGLRRQPGGRRRGRDRAGPHVPVVPADQLPPAAARRTRGNRRRCHSSTA